MTRALTDRVIDARIRQAAAWGVPAEEICARYQLNLQRVRRVLTGEAPPPPPPPCAEVPEPTPPVVPEPDDEMPEESVSPEQVRSAIDLPAGFGLIVETRAGGYVYRGKSVTAEYVVDMAGRRLERAGREA